jgi:ribosomal protein RSM22 (predicted rRNA methylase)
VAPPSLSILNDRAAALFHAAGQWAEKNCKKSLPREVARLSQLFTVQRKDRTADYLADPGLRQAYVGYFAPLNAAKVAFLLHRIFQEGKITTFPSAPRVADLGSGPFSGLLGSWLFFEQLSGAFALDRSKRALEQGSQLWKIAVGSEGATPHWQRAILGQRGFPKKQHGMFDLVILGNVLNEIGDPRRGHGLRLRIIQNCMQLLSREGFLLIVEPGTRVHGRSLQRLRDSLTQETRNTVVSPCPPIDKCPLLIRRSDWCHQELFWNRPEWCARLEKRAGLQNDVLKCSHLLVSMVGGDVPKATGCLVGGLMKSADGERRYICQKEGLFTLSAKKDRLPRPVRQAFRGETLQNLPPGTKIDRANFHPSDDKRYKRKAFPNPED